MNKPEQNLSLHDSRTPYSAANWKNTRLHRARARLGVTFQIFITNLTRESCAIILR